MEEESKRRLHKFRQIFIIGVVIVGLVLLFTPIIYLFIENQRGEFKGLNLLDKEQSIVLNILFLVFFFYVLISIVGGLFLKKTDEQILKDLEAKILLEKEKKKRIDARKAKDAFLFNVSHDIRTSLTTISGYIEMARDNLGDEQKIIDYLNKIDLSSHELLGMINKILDIASIDTGRVPMQQNATKITDVIDSIYQESLLSAADSGVSFKKNISVISDELVFADELRIKQIISNLLDNSFKFTPHGGQVKLTVRQDKSLNDDIISYVFEVEDNGVGMSKDFIGIAFNEFTREETSTIKKVDGIGLGLSIVKSLVTAMEGKVNIESTQGIGTKVTVRLNLKKVIKEVTKTNKDISKKLVLVVDDNKMSREIACEVLKENGLYVEEASSGEEALEIVSNTAFDKFDFILMDIQMPKMDGYEATKRIRNLSNNEISSVPIIAMTANSYPGDDKKAIECGMNAYLTKPLNAETLIETLKKFAK